MGYLPLFSRVERPARLQRTAAALVVGLAVGAVLFALRPAPDAVAPAQAVVQTPRAPVLAAAGSEMKPVPRRIYPYSIVPGGVANRAELLSVIRTDRVVSEHYATFDATKAHPVTVAKARAVHVSYRKGDKVYWTSKKIMLVEGETLLTDGVNEMRARCANRISDVAQFPVDADEPSADMLDASFEAALPEGESAALVQVSAPELGEDAPAANGNAGIGNSFQPQSVGIEGETDRSAQWESASPGMIVGRAARQPAMSWRAPVQAFGDTRPIDPPDRLPTATPVSWIDDPALARAAVSPPTVPGESPPRALPDPHPFIPEAVPAPQAPVAGIAPDKPAPADIPEPGTPWLVGGALALIMSLRRMARGQGQV